jgi:hypothetical protein
MSNNFAQTIQNMRKNRLNILRTYKYELDTAVSNKEISFSGNICYAVNSSSSTSKVLIRFNQMGEQAIEFTQGFGLITPFDKLYISWDAQAGETITLLIGVEAPDNVDIVDNRSQSQSTEILDYILDQLSGKVTAIGFNQATIGVSPVKVVPSNVLRCSACLQSKASNIGKIYVGFDNTVTTTKFAAELERGDSFGIDDYQGDIYAISDTASQYIGYGEV